MPEYKKALENQLGDGALEKFDQSAKDNMSNMSQSHFLVDGVFCSFNCCLAFIQENSKNMLYDKSKQLLYKMYMICFPQIPETQAIIAAPHWRLLKDYGGHLSIEEFRKKFNKLIYVEDTFTNKSISWIYREDVIF